jgi:hypothetical protein
MARRGRRKAMPENRAYYERLGYMMEKRLDDG